MLSPKTEYRRRRTQTLVLVLVACVLGLLVRVPDLEQRPMHHDEANQAVKFAQLLEDGRYAYDQEDHHGPSLYYLTLPFAWLTGVDSSVELSENLLRLVPAVFGVLLIFLMFLVGDAMGTVPAAAAALLIALSPCMVFYSRYYIQEMLLVFFSMAAIAASWRTIHSGSFIWAALAGMSLGLMHATKETCIMSWAAMGGGFLFALYHARHRHGEWGRLVKRVRDWMHHRIMALGAACMISALFFSSFLTDPKGIIRSITAYAGYFAKGAGDGGLHVYPWHFYFHRLLWYKTPLGIWSEAAIFVLGMVGIIAVLRDRRHERVAREFGVFMVGYTVLLTIAYTVVPYKTPWCALSFLHGWIVLAGYGVGCFWSMSRRVWVKAIVTVVLLLPCWQLGRQTYRAAYRFAADERNPYVYEHTSPTFMRLIRRIEAIADVSPHGRDLYIAVAAPPDKYWPLPWYLRGYRNVGYTPDPSLLVTNPMPAIVITSDETYDLVWPLVEGGYLQEMYGVRPDVLLYPWIRMDLWDAFMATRQ